MQGENGQKDPKMVTHQYSRILDEDRRRISQKLDDEFYSKNLPDLTANDSVIKLLTAFQNNPDAFNKLIGELNAG